MQRGSSDTSDIHATIRDAWKASAHSYDSQPGHGMQSPREVRAWQRLLGRVFDPLASEAPLRILDVGTGTGDMAVLMANMGYRVTGVDLTPEMMELARAKAERLGVALTLLEGRADQLPCADAAFDVVFSRHLLWTLPDPLAALREWARVVRSGGIVAVADGWWGEPSRDMKARRAIGSALRKVFERSGPAHADYGALRDRLPLYGGVSPYSVRYFLDGAGLERIVVRDLKAIRAAERRSMPPWRWIDQARHTWLATGYRPS